MNNINETLGLWGQLNHRTYSSYNYFNIDYDTFTREVMAIIDKYKEKESDKLSPKKKMERMRFDVTK